MKTRVREKQHSNARAGHGALSLPPSLFYLVLVLFIVSDKSFILPKELIWEINALDELFVRILA